jgi:hypothetical protein
MSILQKLTEGVVTRDVSKEGAALLEKWQTTGLLEGLDNDRKAQSMAVLLENQAKELLREASSMAAGDVEGFAAVAFPIVRRVFGGLIANDLVSVQPMSLPSGLLFFLDFSHTHGRAGMAAGESIYGGNKLGRHLIDGVDLDGDLSSGGPGGFYDLGTGYSSPTGSVSAALNTGLGVRTVHLGVDGKLVSALTEADKKLIKFDPDLLANTGYTVQVLDCDYDSISSDLNENALGAIELEMNGAGDQIVIYDKSATGGDDFETTVKHVRRLTQKIGTDRLRIVLVDTGGNDLDIGAGDVQAGADKDQLGVASYPLVDAFAVAGTHAVGGVKGTEPWGLELAAASKAGGNDLIPEIDIKVDSVAVTAVTKKLKAKWTPELGQDLNAYHNLDAEVELTGILSEQIALEIDQEILGDLVNGAKAGTRYWSRAPGLFVDSNGAELGATAAAPDFTGTVSEWYETLIETINDVSAQIHRKTLRGGANFVVCSPEVANILEFTSGFRASVTADQDRGTIGAQNVGSLSKKFDVMVDPYFPRNVILVGRKGSSFLESGYVYAPYVPLQVTPTIFGTEDFVPRKGVMTRYAKKMVRPDMYGIVIVRGLLGEAGAS